MSAVDHLLLTAEEAAESLSLGRTRVYALIATGELRSVKIGRSRRVPAAALADFVAQLDTGAAELKSVS